GYFDDVAVRGQATVRSGKRLDASRIGELVRRQSGQRETNRTQRGAGARRGVAELIAGLGIADFVSQQPAMQAKETAFGVGAAPGVDDGPGRGDVPANEQ